MLVPSAMTAPVLSIMPSSQVIALNGAAARATFDVLANGTPSPLYQWQRFSGGAWVDLTADATFIGTTGPRLLVSATDLSLNGVSLRAVASNSAGSVATDPVTLSVIATGQAPTWTEQPSALVLGPSGSGAFRARASGAGPISYQWQRNGVDIPGAIGPTLSIVGVASGHGGNYTVTATNTFGSITSTPASLTALTAMSPTALRFGATRASTGAISAVTSGQNITVEFTGPTPASWTASANQPWLRVTPATGSGSGVVQVSVSDSTNALAGMASATGTVTLTSSGISRTVSVTLDIAAAATTRAPVGQVDTPALNASLQGAASFSGWVVDDVGIQGVQVFRNCLPAEASGICQGDVYPGAPPLVYLGDAVFVAGARPDVEAAFVQYPASNVAGWGFLLLTNMLPRSTGTYAPQGGQGPISLYAVATDLEGNKVPLPRAWNAAHQPTTVTLNNDAIAKPFGTIDTPAQGGTVSGSAYGNYGWALSPDSLIPVNGSTIGVYIDGVRVGQPQFNHCRGSVGTPVPAGLFCDDDVANIFGNTEPRAPFTPRTSNPSRFPNLNESRGPQGAYFINATTLASGLHTISWTVQDSGGRSEGIGSRYFSVLAGTTSARPAARPAPDAFPLSGVTTVRGRAGYSEDASWVEVPANPDGVRHVSIPEMGRFELEFGEGVTFGALVANGHARDLPPGTTMRDGRFAWMPGPGFIGDYTLLFYGPAGRATVVVTVKPKGRADESVAVRMAIDESPAVPARSRTIQLSGWAIDTEAFAGSGVGAVHVWARRVDRPDSPVFVGAAQLGRERADVHARFGYQSLSSGFTLEASLPSGLYEVTAYVWLERTGRFEDARTVLLRVRD